MKQQLLDYISPLAKQGYHFYLAGIGLNGCKYRDTCKELFLRASNFQNHKHFGFVCPRAYIKKALSAWKLNNLPEFDYEIIEVEKGCLLYFEM